MLLLLLGCCHCCYCCRLIRPCCIMLGLLLRLLWLLLGMMVLL